MMKLCNKKAFRNLNSILAFLTLAASSVHAAQPENIYDNEMYDLPIELFDEGELKRLVDEFTPRELSDSVERLDVRCSAALTLGLYNDFFDCMKVWRNTSFSHALGLTYDPIEEGEIYQESERHLMLIRRSAYRYSNDRPENSYYTRQEVEGREQRLLAEAWFQLGDYQKAFNHSKQALRAYDVSWSYWSPEAHYDWGKDQLATDRSWIGWAPQWRLPGGDMMSAWQSDIVISASFAAQSAIKLGQPELLPEYMNIIDSIHKTPSNDEPLVGYNRVRTTYKNAINIAAGNFNQVQISSKGFDEYFEEVQGIGLMVTGVAIGALGGQAGGDIGRMGYEMVVRGNTEAIIMREEFQNALISSHRKQWDDALGYLDDVLDNEEIASFSELKQLAFQQKGMALVNVNKQQDALDAFSQAIDIIENSRGNVSTEAQKLGYFGDKDMPYQQSTKILIEQGRFEDAFAMAERARSRALVDMLADTQLRRGQLPANLAPVTLTVAANDSANSTFASDQSTLRTRALKRATPKQRKKIEAQTLTRVQSFTAKELQALLAPNELLIEYIQIDDQWFAFKVTQNQVTAIELTLNKLNERVEQYRRQLQSPTSDAYQALSQSLYNDLISPLNLDAGQALTLVPSGALNYLPFSTLHDGRAFLLEQRTVTLLPSATSKAFLSSRHSSPRLLAMGNPTGDLPGAEAEVAALKVGMKGATTVQRNQATETLLKTQGGKFNMLHIASHGEFNPDDPSASRLLLAPDASNDGDLTMAEIYGLELNANLVVLSACETGLNEIKQGEEIFGLTRGFLYAGSSNIVASLWKVDDDATKQLMTSFYARLKTESYSKALRDAQLSLQQSRNYRHPFYWAAFQLTGEG